MIKAALLGQVSTNSFFESVYLTLLLVFFSLRMSSHAEYFYEGREGDYVNPDYVKLSSFRQPTRGPTSQLHN